MKLTELDNNNPAVKALKENFEINFNPKKLDKLTTRSMLSKVRGLIKEAKTASDFYKNQTSPTYLKLVFMEQALVKHFANLNNNQVRIVVENEEVEKSQVILAAQDMVDSVQKMIENVNDMLVKELPALADSIKSEIGVAEGDNFNQVATEALSSLNQTLMQSKQGLQSALGSITGQEMAAPGAFGGEAEEAMPPEEGGELPPEGEEALPEPPAEELPAEEPEEPVGGVGRAKR